MKYIILANWLLTYITLEPYTFCKELVKHGWILVLLSDTNTVKTVLNSDNIVLFVTYESCDITKYDIHANCKIIYKFDDQHSRTEISKNFIGKSALVISPYAYLLNDMNAFFCPYSYIDKYTSLIKFNDTPTNKIFCSGAVNFHYPFREYVVRLSDDLVFKSHPGYRPVKEDSQDTGFNYYSQMNSFLCCFTDASMYRYILLKNFEIAGSGSLLLTDDSIEKEMNGLGFIDGETCMFCNRGNFLEKVAFIVNLENREYIDKIRRAGMKLVHDRHLTSHRAALFNEKINSTLL